MRLFLGFFLIVLVLISCSPKIRPYTGEVNFIYKDVQGTIALKSKGYGKNQLNAVTDAQKNAFRVILFKGIPGTELNIPLIDNENEAINKNPDYFKKFFDDEKYKSFIISSTESSNLVKLKGTNSIFVDVKINYNSLRKDLEQYQVIRKFGY
jgi:hypothetical protein